MRLVLSLAWKDLRIEFRSKKRVSVLLLFSFVLAFVGSFAYRWQDNEVAYLPPLLWLIAVFAQLLFLGETYHHEGENGCFDALRISPARGYQLLMGKLLASLTLVFLVNAAVVLEITFFTTASQLLRLDVFALLLLESIGLLALGNLFFARKASGESTGLDLFPLVATLSVPLVFVSMEISQVTLRGGPVADQAVHYALLIGYDVFLLVACSIAYRSMIED